MRVKITIIISFIFIQTLAFGQTDSVNVVDGALVSDYTKPVTIQLMNSTGYDIDTLIFYNIYFPKLQKDSSTIFFNIPNYEESDFISGKIQNLKIDNGMWNWDCKPGPFDYENKTIIVEIVLAESQMLKKHYRLETRIKEIIE